MKFSTQKETVNCLGNSVRLLQLCKLTLDSSKRRRQIGEEGGDQRYIARWRTKTTEKENNKNSNKDKGRSNMQKGVRRWNVTKEAQPEALEQQ